MDVVGWLLQQPGLPAYAQYLETWAGDYRYASHTTLLFWAPNHALPAWLLTLVVWRHRAQGLHAPAAALLLLAGEMDTAEAEGHAVPDDRLRLFFVCAHPAIDAAARTPLMLQTVLGLDAARMAGAFLTSPATLSQRLVRAKTRIRNARIPFEYPQARELPQRLQDVLDGWYGTGTARVILPITDPYVVHHGALGSFATVYAPDEGSVPGWIERIRQVPGMESVLSRKEAAQRFELPADRIGDIVVVSEKNTVIGTAASRHDLS
eukprot:gene18018-20526_t